MRPKATLMLGDLLLDFSRLCLASQRDLPQFTQNYGVAGVTVGGEADDAVGAEDHDGGDVVDAVASERLHCLTGPVPVVPLANSGVIAIMTRVNAAGLFGTARAEKGLGK